MNIENPTLNRLDSVDKEVNTYMKIVNVHFVQWIIAALFLLALLSR